jgi:ribonuclease HII
MVTLALAREVVNSEGMASQMSENKPVSSSAATIGNRVAIPSEAGNLLFFAWARNFACTNFCCGRRWWTTSSFSMVKSSVMKLSSARTISASAAKLRLLKKLRCTLRYEKKAWAGGARLVAGVDEVGRGSLFGCVVAAAVILDPAYRVRGLRDSKLLLPERREALAERIREHAVAWAVAAVDSARIDQINIYQASRLAMREAVMRLAPVADHLLIDALRIDCEQPQVPIIHGDALSASIAAASILAKVERDRIMCEWDAVFPAYGLAAHKGYSTPRHLAALREYGPTPLHRQSFAPVWQNPVPQEVIGFMDEDVILEDTIAG